MPEDDIIMWTKPGIQTPSFGDVAEVIVGEPKAVPAIFFLGVLDRCKP